MELTPWQEQVTAHCKKTPVLESLPVPESLQPEALNLF